MRLGEVVIKYMKFRGMQVPNNIEALLFLMSEVGELCDSLVSNMSEKWVRNHPEKKVTSRQWTEDEVGDVLMMLTATCNAMGLDPIECMMNKMKSKGFDASELQ